jgi:hypothetical protein
MEAPVMRAIILVVLSLGAADVAAAPGWEIAAVAPPTGPVVWDEVRQEMILVPPVGGAPEPIATFAWNGQRWRIAAAGGPPARAGAALAFDPDHGRVILYGGCTYAGQCFHDFWAWDGGAWSFLGAGTDGSATYPARSAALVYDGISHRFLMVGDYGTSVWNGTAWDFIPGGPGSPQGFGAAIAYDSGRGRVVLFGGENQATLQWYLGDTWEWDGVAWTRVATTGPAARAGAGLVYDAARGRVVLHGGYATDWLEDTWEWNGTTWSQGAATGPQRIGGLAFDPERGVVVAQDDLGTTWGWDGQSWSPLARVPTSPVAMAHDRAHGRTVLLAAALDGTTAAGSTWEWDGLSWTLAAADGPPAASGGSGAMVWDDARGRGVLVGGGDSSDQVRTSEWDGASWRAAASVPRARWQFGLAYDALRGRTVLQGGTEWVEDNPPFQLDDTWEYDGTSWQLMSSGGPSPGGHPMAWDASAGAVVLVDWSLGATLAWRGVAWEQVGGLPAEIGAGGLLATDPVGGHVILVNAYAGRAWAFDGAAWSETAGVAATTPLLAGVPERQRVVLLASGGAVSTTWEYRAEAGCAANAECASGHCVAGVCCDEACDGLCTVCNLAGHFGTCTTVPDGQDPHGDCRAPADGAAICAGTCRGARCEFPEHVCGPCLACDGTGHCEAPSDLPCDGGALVADGGVRPGDAGVAGDAQPGASQPDGCAAGRRASGGGALGLLLVGLPRMTRRRRRR